MTTSVKEKDIPDHELFGRLADRKQIVYDVQQESRTNIKNESVHSRYDFLYKAVWL